MADSPFYTKTPAGKMRIASDREVMDYIMSLDAERLKAIPAPAILKWPDLIALLEKAVEHKVEGEQA